MPSRDLQIWALDGWPLRATLFTPTRAMSPVTVVVVNSATGVHRRFYARFATYLAERCGYYVLTYDYRGMADSRPKSFRAFSGRIRDWPHYDMPAALDWMRKEYHPARVFLVGHSAGGNLIGLMPNVGVIDAVLFVGAQLGYWRLWPRSIRYAMAATWYVAVPVLAKVFGYVPGWLGAGQHWPRGIAVELARWCRHPDYLFGDPSLDTKQYAELEAPILALTFTDDPHATRAASDHLLARFPQAAITHRHIDPSELGVKRIGHFGFFRPFCQPLWEQCASWFHAIPAKSTPTDPLTTRVAARPFEAAIATPANSLANQDRR